MFSSVHKINFVTLLIMSLSITALASEMEMDFSDDIEAIETKSDQQNSGVIKSKKIKKNDQNQIRINFNDEINQLDTVPENDYRAGSWGSDIQAWNEGKTTISNRKQREKLSELTKQCQSFWNSSDRATCKFQHSSPIVLFEECTHYACIKKYGAKCRRRGFEENKPGFSSCIRAMKKKAYRDFRKRRSIENDKGRARAKRAQQQCKVEREYCKEVKADVTEGKLPTKSYPAWTAIDEQSFTASMTFFDLALEKSLIAAEQEAIKAKIEQIKVQDKKNAALERLAILKRKAQDVRSKHEQSCLIHIGGGGDSCACAEFLPIGSEVCGK